MNLRSNYSVIAHNTTVKSKWHKVHPPLEHSWGLQVSGFVFLSGLFNRTFTESHTIPSPASLHF
jgi:hypothetical protein